MLIWDQFGVIQNFQMSPISQTTFLGGNFCRLLHQDMYDFDTFHWKKSSNRSTQHKFVTMTCGHTHYNLRVAYVVVQLLAITSVSLHKGH